jgi:uncharacterized membrane protein
MMMTHSILTILLWFAAIGSGLIAGLFFAFSAFVMTALAGIPQAHGISAMRSINSTILGSLFIPLFYGTVVASLLLAGLALFRWEVPGSVATLSAAITYLLGMFLCTVIFNVPLNHELDSVDPESAEAASVWSRYLKDWTLWNHVRTSASTVACGLFVAALLAAGSRAP